MTCNIKEIGDSKPIAIKRFLYLEWKFQSNHELKEVYSEFLAGQLVTYDELDVKAYYYVPHYTVIKRNVDFNVSAKSSSNF